MSAVTRERRRGSVRYDPGRVRPRRPLATEAPHVLHVRADDGVMLRLTRYRGGRKGPVILSHCVGVSSRMYSIDTIEPNLLEHLSAAGYDVWLLDYRFSIELEAASRQSSMDDVALRDYPAAVAAVREATGAATIQIVAHGVGASTLTMALLAGLDGVRAVVLSQVSTHLETVLVNRLKAQSRMPDVLRLLGGRTLTAYTDVSAGWPERLYDATLASLPAKPEERCSSPVCRRITALFGELYKHRWLNDATHDALPEMFGLVNLRAFGQLSRIVRARHIVDERGDERYLPHLERLALPIAFIHGGANECVLPRSTERTLDLLTEANGAHHYRRHVIDGYGHVDCIFGYRAAQDVYGHILAHLDATS